MGSQEIKRQSFAVDEPFVGLGCIIERVDTFLLELPKGQPIKCLTMDSADWKQEKRLYFIMLCGQNSRILWQRLTLSLIHTMQWRLCHRNGWSFPSWTSKGTTNKMLQLWSPTTKNRRKGYIFIMLWGRIRHILWQRFILSPLHII